jgi:hypothetical protein
MIRAIAMKFAILLCGGLLLLNGVSFAQSGSTGSLTGTVQDVNGALLPGVQVMAVHIGTDDKRTVSTDTSGRWTIPSLAVGEYQVTFEAAGFKKKVREKVSVEAAVPRTLDETLEVGDIGETITITEDVALATPDTSTTFRQISGLEVVQVPTSTRSFTHLLSAEAGVSSDLPPVLTNGNGNISPSVNGTRTTSTSLFFNGIDATNITSNEGSLTDNIAPAPETLEEVKLQTSLYDASTGRSGGGNFQLITKRGTNDFNGSIYYYAQNEKFNANDFFFNKEGIDKPRARRHEGGFTIGGPIIKEKIFFFGGYQHTKADTGFVPTASSRTVLPAALGLISGPRTAANVASAFRSLNSSFPLTAADISPVTLRLLNIINPATGDYLIPSPRANAERLLRTDQTVSGWTGGNPLVSQRNVLPAQFEQNQFTLRMDSKLTSKNSINATYFFSNFPALDPFPDPNSLASPVTLKRNDRNRTLAISDLHVFNGSWINEARFGFFSLNNTRRLDDPFLAITNESVGIPNPANFFDRSNATTRLGHYVGRNELQNFSFGGPNDVFNRRKQESISWANNVTNIRGSHTIRFGVEYKSHKFDTNLPEEQATEFEKFDNFTQFLAGRATEADTQFGITDKTFLFRDIGGYIADDWKLTRKLTLNLGLRYEFFAWPEERHGRIGNFDFENLTNTENPSAGFIVPSNVMHTGFAAIDAAIDNTTRANNKHTLKGQDLNNFAPRIGFAYSPLASNRLVIRGGYGIFYDRPSAAFINTVFSNYPFLREIEVTAPNRQIRLENAFSQQDPTLPLNQYLPNRIVYIPSSRTYEIRDNTPVIRDANGGLNPADPTRPGQRITGNVAETFEFRAIDRNLRTPYIQQWNFGFQHEVTKNLLFEARYVGTKGTKLLQAVAFNQGYDLNDPNTPDYIFERFNRAYVASGGTLNPGATARERGTGRAFGFRNQFNGREIDYNLSNPIVFSPTGAYQSGGNIIGFESRGPILGFNIPEAVLLTSSANSIYHGAQFGLTHRLTRGLQFNAAYTWSKSIDNNSADPGSTAGGGKPDVPNTGFVVQGDQRNLRSNRALSDFDRTHRFSASFVYEIPSFGSTSRFLTGWQISGFAQVQSGTPFSIFASEPETTTANQFNDLTRGSGGLYRLGFGRPNLIGTLDQLREQGEDPTERYFNRDVLASPRGGFGNLGRNVLRGPIQKRFDIGLSKTTTITEQTKLTFRWDVFNVFNNVNFANPNSDLQDGVDFGTITNTLGGPRVMQFGLKLTF